MALVRPAQAVDVQVELSPDLAAHGIKAIGYTDPQHKALLNNLIGSNNTDAIASILPLILIVINDGNIPIVQLTIRYPRTTPDGSPIEGVQAYNFDSFGRYTTFALSPDGLLTDWFRKLATDHGAVASLQLTNQSNQLLKFNFNPVRFPKTTVSLDSVILSDGTVIGPDRHNVIALETAKAAVDAELLGKLNDLSTSDDDLRKWLTDLTGDIKQGRVIAPNTGNPDEAKIYRSNLAKLTLTQLSSHGRLGTARWLQAVAGNRRIPVSNLHHSE
jgi:hypothetical protein